MRSSILSLLLFTSYMNAQEIVDFGVQGTEYPIVEQNANEMVQEGMKKLNWAALEKENDDKIEALKTSNVKIKTSLIDSEKVEIDIYRAKYDILNYDGRVLYRKGDRIPTDIQKGIRFELCFVDGSLLEAVVDRIVEQFGSKCKYLVNKKNIDVFSLKYNVEAFPMGGQNTPYLSRYRIERLPTKITRYEDKIERETISVKRLSLEIATRNR